MVMEEEKIVVKEKWRKTKDGQVLRIWTTDDWHTWTIEETALTDFPYVFADWNNYCWPVDERRD